MATGQIQPMSCFCTAHHLRIGFTFVKLLKKKKKGKIRNRPYMAYKALNIYCIAQAFTEKVC